MGKLNKQQVKYGWRRIQLWLTRNANINMRSGTCRSVCREYAKANNITLNTTTKNWHLRFIIDQYNDPTSKIYKDAKKQKPSLKKATEAGFNKTDRKKEYNAYMKSAKWIGFSKEIKTKRGSRCEICGDSDSVLDAHHLTYERFGNELESDIQIVCRSCHEKIHGRSFKIKAVSAKKTTIPTCNKDSIIFFEKSVLPHLKKYYSVFDIGSGQFKIINSLTGFWTIYMPNEKKCFIPSINIWSDFKNISNNKLVECIEVHLLEDDIDKAASLRNFGWNPTKT